jgi:hypothetical protein
MSIILGVASFVYILRTLNKEMCLNGEFLSVFGSNPQSFLLTARKGMSLICGFIQTDQKTLNRLFNKDEIGIVLESCEKNKDDSYLHCPIKDTDKRGDIETTVDGKIFNCLLDN